MYQRGKIYKIQSASTDQVYIGSTVEKTLAQRMAGHRANYRRYLTDGYHYVTSFELLQHADANIVLVESFPCASKDELRAREQYWIDSIPNTVNRQRAKGLSKAEYYEKNKEVIAAKLAKYYQENKEVILAQRTKYYQENKEVIAAKAKVRTDCACGGRYTCSNKLRHFQSVKHCRWLEAQEEAQMQMNDVDAPTQVEVEA